MYRGICVFNIIIIPSKDPIKHPLLKRLAGQEELAQMATQTFLYIFFDLFFLVKGIVLLNAFTREKNREHGKSVTKGGVTGEEKLSIGNGYPLKGNGDRSFKEISVGGGGRRP